MTSDAVEFNFDGLVGPTHNYAGLGQGNLASQQNRHLVSHPKKAALEGLEKMKFMAELGVPQGVLPPQERPHVPTLRRLGFSGSDAEVVGRAAREAPQLLAACSSASAMWAANAATVSPSADAGDGRVHMTAANLSSHLHRSIEAEMTEVILREIFKGPGFVHHEPLPGTPDLADEGAANHNRLCVGQGEAGVELFVYGREPGKGVEGAGRFRARHSRVASEGVARMHLLRGERTLLARQHPAAIEAGVFHNDVIAVGHRDVFLYHEMAFADGGEVLEGLRRAFGGAGGELVAVCVPEAVLPLGDAVRSYLFNSQLVTGADGKMVLVAPRECGEMASAVAAIDFIRRQAPAIGAVHFVDVRQSMCNGGGPACLRLRVVLTAEERGAVHAGVVFSAGLYGELRGWIERRYREELRPTDLADPKLLEESRAALDELTGILKLPAIYEFQRA